MFVKLGSVIAWLLFGFGALRTLLGFFFAFGTDTMEANEFAARRYLASANTGEAINEGIMLIVAGVAIGLIVQIANNTAEK